MNPQEPDPYEQRINYSHRVQYCYTIDPFGIFGGRVGDGNRDIFS